MASIIFNSFFEDLARGNIDLDSDTIKCMLVNATYVEDQDAHTRRSHITGEIAAAAGYTLGGQTVAVTIIKDNANNRVDLGLGGAVWTAPLGQTLTGRKAIYYKSRGGNAAADELIACIDFTADQVASGGTFTLGGSILRLQN